MGASKLFTLYLYVLSKKSCKRVIKPINANSFLKRQNVVVKEALHFEQPEWKAVDGHVCQSCFTSLGRMCRDTVGMKLTPRSDSKKRDVRALTPSKTTQKVGILKPVRSCTIVVPSESSELSRSHESGPEEKPRPISNDSSSEIAKDEGFHFSSSPTMEDIRKIMASFVEERNWDQFHSPKNLLLALVGEVGELAELFQWREVKEGIPDWTDAERRHLGEELSDVLVYLVRLADKVRVDLPAAALSKIALNAEKYPVSKCYGKSNKYTEYQ
ncbi:PREDICTED: uncharacterized protein LOC106816312 [Priapulus caudatus]|uniref:Uncharacterized protein LOC106816312 n=1 Tax=Priapulus caudatus TaxID=37621 RepID=A0ABM1EW06_PRICU|nr:PREDICTED: uncharacterized protein LOC106816312 [Priapulus caudatus]